MPKAVIVFMFESFLRLCYKEHLFWQHVVLLSCTYIVFLNRQLSQLSAQIAIFCGAFMLSIMMDWTQVIILWASGLVCKKNQNKIQT